MVAPVSWTLSVRHGAIVAQVFSSGEDRQDLFVVMRGSEADHCFQISPPLLLPCTVSRAPAGDAY
jgi:hypothetical protein